MLTQQGLTYAIGIGTLLTFGITLYNSLKKPQERSEVNDAVFEERFKNLRGESNTKIDTLEKTVLNLRDNHIHTISEKLDKHIADNQMAAEVNIRQMTRIETLLEERLPRKS